MSTIKIEDAASIATRICTISYDAYGHKLDRKRMFAAIVSGRKVSLIGPIAIHGTTTTTAPITIIAADSFDATAALIKEGYKKPLVLDFASDTTAGGGWRGKQRGTQEESLCRRSSLGLSLEKAKYPIGTDQGIYVADVAVWLGSTMMPHEPFWCSVLAASLRHAPEKDIERRVTGILKVAVENKHDCFVLGAWGCGAFSNDPTVVASAFKNAISLVKPTYKIVFAIPKGDNLAAFQAVFSGTAPRLR